MHLLDNSAGSRFDPVLVSKFAGLLHDVRHESIETKVIEIDITELKEGMVLASDIKTKRGLLLMSKGETVLLQLLNKILNFHKIDPVVMKIAVLQNNRK